MIIALVVAINRGRPVWRRNAGLETGENISITALSGKIVIKFRTPYLWEE